MNPRYEGAVVGGGSIWLPREKRREVDPSAAWRGLALTPSCLARVRLVELLEATGRKRVGWCKRTLGQIRNVHPLHCQPGDGQYIAVDLTACFWSIYSRLWLDTKYDGVHFGTGAAPLAALGQGFAEDKRLRNSVIGLVRSLRIRKVHAGRLITHEANNKLLAPELWGFLSDLLHAVAHRAIELGAVYWHTDGGLFPRAAQAGYERWFGEMVAIGLSPRLVAHGRGYVRAPGTWAIGDLKKGLALRSHAMSNVHCGKKSLHWWTYVHRQYQTGRYSLVIPNYGDMHMKYTTESNRLLEIEDLQEEHALQVRSIRFTGPQHVHLSTELGPVYFQLTETDRLALNAAFCGEVALYLLPTPEALHLVGEPEQDGKWEITGCGKFSFHHTYPEM